MSIFKIKSWIIDDFVDYDTKTLLRGSEATPLEKAKIFKVLNYLSETSDPKYSEHSDFHNLVRSIANNTGNDTEKYDLLKSNIEGCKSDECLLLLAAMTYGLYPKSLLMDTIAIHSRIKQLDNKDAWFDNFSLNSFLLQLTTIVYEKYEDSSKDKSVKSVPDPQIFQNLSGGNNINIDPRYEAYQYDLNFKQNSKQISKHITTLNGGNISKINTSIKLSNPKELLKHLGNEYRCFFETGKLSNQIKSDDEAIKILDMLAEKYPYYTGCTHGCDVFTSDFRDKSVSISDIKEFCKRYPMNIVGYILNTKTYKSGRGQHWVALLFKGGCCYLICSQASGFNGFEETTLISDLEKSGFAMLNNTKTIQHDPSSCGLYSVLSNACFILEASGNNKPDITKIIEMIGGEGKNINAKGIYNIKKILAGYK